MRSLRWRLAWRNLLRNGRRTTLNIIMIVGGFAAMVMFQGFAASVLGGLRGAVIDVQFGHFQVGTDNSWEMKPDSTAEDRLIAEPQALIDVLKTTADYDYISGRLTFHTMVSTSENSVSARAVAFNPSIEVGMRDGMSLIEGQQLSGDEAFELLVGEGLAKSLQATPGESITLLAQTLEGYVNAIDVDFKGIVSTGVSEIDNITIYLPLKTAQRLLATDRVERLVFNLKGDRYDVSSEISRVSPLLPEGTSAKSWWDLAELYRQSKEFFDVQNLIISLMIATLVLLSISNTVSNSVIERTGEIGTVRALGDRRREVVVQFVMEAILLAAISGAIGVVTSAVLSMGISSMGLVVTIPGATKPIPLGISILPIAYLEALLLTSVTVLLATYWPVKKISKTPIVEALKRNI